MKKVVVLLWLLVISIGVGIGQTVKPKAIAPYTPAIMANGTLYISGQIPRIPETGVLIQGDIKKATEQCMKNIGILLKEHDLSHEDLVMVNIYMTDMDNYQKINEVYRTFFPNEKFPARAAIQIGRLPMNAEIEISGIAVKRQ